MSGSLIRKRNAKLLPYMKRSRVFVLAFCAPRAVFSCSTVSGHTCFADALDDNASGSLGADINHFWEIVCLCQLPITLRHALPLENFSNCDEESDFASRSSICSFIESANYRRRKRENFFYFHASKPTAEKKKKCLQTRRRGKGEWKQ